MNAHKDFVKVFRTAHNAGRELASLTAIEGGKMNELPGAMAMAMAPVAGALQVVAMAVAPHDDDGWQPSQEQMTFAALLTLACVQGDGLNYCPESFLAAFQAYENLTGRKPDSFLLEPFVNAVRDVERESEKPLAAFMQARHNGTTH